MPITYIMEAKDNYSPSFATAFSSGSAPFDHQPTYSLFNGSMFDVLRRRILYNANIYNTTETNTTGVNLWSGQNLIAPGGTVDSGSQWNQYICEINVDSSAVTFHNCYNASKKVPSGVQGIKGTVTAGGTGYVQGVYLAVPLTGGTGHGATCSVIVNGSGVVIGVGQLTGATSYTNGDVLSASNTHLGGSGSGFQFTLNGATANSDGTWQRFVEAEYSSIPQLVDPNTGDTWIHVDSFDGKFVCTVYCFRMSDSYAQIISPLLPVNPHAHMEPIGITNNWTYVKEETGTLTPVPSNNHIALTPRTFQAQETTNDFLLTYAYFDYPTIFNNMIDANAFVFTQNQNFYAIYSAWQDFGGGTVAARDYRLFRFDEPSSAPFGGPVVGGGFTEVTPWGPATGPNTNAANYVYTQFVPTTSYLVQNEIDYYFPVTNQLGLISKFMSWQTQFSSTDPTGTFFDLTYFDIGGATFDYHHAFVTGYMNANWTPGNSGTAAYVVIDALDMNMHLKENSYVFPGVDYTKRWLSFIVQKYSGSFTPNINNWHIVFVQYQFAYGSSPTVLKVIDEDGWDAAYTAYATAIGNTNVVWNSTGAHNQDAEQNPTGIYDDAAGTFWWGGQDYNIWQLNPPIWTQREHFDVTGPLLKLSFSGSVAPGTHATQLRIWGNYHYIPVTAVVDPNARSTQSGDNRVIMTGATRDIIP